MNLILLSEDDFIAGNRALLHDRRFQHIAQIHHSTVGDTVRVGVIDGLTGVGTIRAIDDRQVDIEVSLDTPPPEKLPLTLLLALPRPKMLRRIFRSVAELGVEKLIIINSYKVEKSFWSSPALEADTVKRHLIDGLQQARDTRLPAIEFKRRFKPFVEDELPALVRDGQALVAHPGGAGVSATTASRTILAIGPEGGFIDYEVDKFRQAGFGILNLGPRIYRVENAISYTIGKLFG